MITGNFKLKYHYNNLYDIVYDGYIVGELEFKIDKFGVMHIYNVYVHEDHIYDLQMWKFFQQFELKAYTVLPEKMNYWRRLGADIVNTAGSVNKFEDIIFEESDFEDLF